MPFISGGGLGAGLDPTVFLARTGGTMLGPLFLRAGDPTADREAVPLGYLEAQLQLHQDAIEIKLVMPAEFEVTGSPAGFDGTFTVGWEEQPANWVLAGPADPADPDATPAFRHLVGDDISDLHAHLADYLPLTGGALTGPLSVAGNVNITGTPAPQFQVNGVALVTGVSSVFGRTGAVVAASGDYTAAQVTNAVSTIGSYADPAWITSLAWSKITGAPTLVNSFNSRTGAVVPATGDYTAAMVTNAVSTIGSYADPAWLTSLAWTKIANPPNFIENPWTANVNANGYVLTSGTTSNTLRIGTGTAAAPTVRMTLQASSTRTYLGVDNDASVIPSSTTGARLMLGNTLGSNTAFFTCCTNTTSTNATIGGLEWANYNIAVTEKRVAAIIVSTSGAANSGVLTIWTGNAGTMSERIRILPNGNVGVALANPAELLDVNGNVRISTMLYSTGALTFGANNTTERMRIATTGRVGIGNDAATTVGGSTIQLIIGSSTATTQGDLVLASNQSSTSAVIGRVYFANYNLATSSKVIASIQAQTDGALDSGRLSFFTGNLGGGTVSERMRITPDGVVYVVNRMGINTTTPGDYRLDVNGDVRIQGTELLLNPAEVTIKWYANQPTFFMKMHHGISGLAGETVGIANDLREQAPFRTNATHLVVGPGQYNRAWVQIVGNGTGQIGLSFSNLASTAAAQDFRVFYIGVSPTGNGANTYFYQRYSVSGNVQTVMQLRDDGNVVMNYNLGIGMNAASYRFQVSTDSAAKPGTNTWTIASDKRTKRNVRRFEGGMEKIRELKPTVAEYNGKCGTPNGLRVVSFDADELRKVVPEAVTRVKAKVEPEDTEEVDVDGINTHEIFFHLLQAVKQIDKRLQRLEALRDI